MDEGAKERGQRVVSILEEAGRKLGLVVELEYPVVGGRIDVVWLWEGPASFAVRLPLVGFEVESSWRSRKHLKGDLFNLLELQPALGVIVLLGEGDDVESTRQFAREMLRRRASRMEVWDEDRVLEVQAADPSVLRDLLVDAGADVQAGAEPALTEHRGKYRELSAWLAAQDVHVVRASFGQIEEVIGRRLPPSSRNHVAHWHSYKGSAVARAIIDAGWRARDVNLTAESVRLERVTGAGAAEEIEPRS